MASSQVAKGAPPDAGFWSEAFVAAGLVAPMILLKLGIPIAFFWARMGRRLTIPERASGHRWGAAAMTHRSHEISQDDLRNLVRIVSASTLGLWAFAAGLLIGVFLL